MPGSFCVMFNELGLEKEETAKLDQSVCVLPICICLGFPGTRIKVVSCHLNYQG
ncbi:mCG1027214 [Mus musculus]|nr:mCG1027214 [Mus musculus]